MSRFDRAGLRVALTCLIAGCAANGACAVDIAPAAAPDFLQSDINPAIDPHIGLRAYLGPQNNLHTGEPYELTEAHLREWEKLYLPRITPKRYLLIVETGDEVLDYGQAVTRYAGAEQVVIAGGDHSLQSFPQHLPRILEFSRATAL